MHDAPLSKPQARFCARFCKFCVLCALDSDLRCPASSRPREWPAREISSATADMNEYELIRVLGKGAYGVAHLAKHKPTGQLWCIKIIGMTGMVRASELQLCDVMLCTYSRPRAVKWVPTIAAVPMAWH